MKKSNALRVWVPSRSWAGKLPMSQALGGFTPVPERSTYGIGAGLLFWLIGFRCFRTNQMRRPAV
jgi:hypothetical protein